MTWRRPCSACFKMWEICGISTSCSAFTPSRRSASLRRFRESTPRATFLAFNGFSLARTNADPAIVFGWPLAFGEDFAFFFRLVSCRVRVLGNSDECGADFNVRIVLLELQLLQCNPALENFRELG